MRFRNEDTTLFIQKHPGPWRWKQIDYEGATCSIPLAELVAKRRFKFKYSRSCNCATIYLNFYGGRGRGNARYVSEYFLRPSCYGTVRLTRSVVPLRRSTRSSDPDGFRPSLYSEFFRLCHSAPIGLVKASTKLPYIY